MQKKFGGGELVELVTFLLGDFFPGGIFRGRLRAWA